MAQPFGPVQSLFKASVSAASITTTAVTTTTGSLLIALVASFGNHVGTTTLSDSKGNTWALAEAGANGTSAIYYAKNITGGAGHTVTFTPTAADFIAITVIEVAAADTSAPLSNHANASSATATHAVGPVSANASVPEILVGIGSIGASVTPLLTVTDPILWYPISLQSGASTEGCATGFYLIAPSLAGTFSYLSTARTEDACIAGFKAAVVAAGGSGGSFTFFGA